MLGAAWIAGRAVIPALRAASNAEVVALASRDRERAAAMAAEHRIPRIHGAYEDLLADRDVDAVYIPLVNSLHRPWTLRALAAGKHVLCEKPLALSAAEAEEMAAAAEASGRLLMEALMYRFHPRARLLRAAHGSPVHVAARFGFPLQAPGNYRLDPALGGGALLDVGSYCVSAARWYLGEPEAIAAVGHLEGGVDLSVAAALAFPGGATATIWGSFESPEAQELVLVGPEGSVRAEQPFTAWRDPDDPYRAMAQEFGQAALSGAPAPLPLEDSIANLRVLDRIRAALR